MTLNLRKDAHPEDVRRVQTGLQSGEIRLADQSPVYHALLDVGGDGVADPNAARLAQRQIGALVQSKPEVIEHCSGKTAEAARQILENALR